MEAFATLLLSSSPNIMYLVGTHVCTLVIVLRLDVGLEMLVTQETFVASFFSTRKRTFVGVRANVHLQADGTVERFAATFIRAYIFLRSF